MDHFDVASGCSRELFEIVPVEGHDLVAVDCEQYDTRIDDVSEPGGGEEDPGGPTKWFVERADIDATERLGQPGLARAAAPHLSQHSRVGQREVSVKLGGLQADPHRAFIALKRDEGAGVEHEAHADFALRLCFAGRR